ncbi:MAG: copper resistance protein B [Gemmatimonadaceae bacterium]|nr:copper resistance protein B [Gemmatimonadaceae bacterium]
MRERRFVATLAAVGALCTGGGAAAAQVPDSTATHPAHGMAWGRETFLLSEVLEYGPAGANRGLDYDLLAWSGGAVHRVWAKVDGGLATQGQSVHGEYQLLYGKLVSPWWDAQLGLRVDQRSEQGTSRSRVGAVVGLQGLAPGWFELEPSLFITADGNAAIDLTASYDLFLTQRLVVQPRLETSAALRDEPTFGVGRGLVSTSFGIRTRLEFRREFAPYVGLVWDRAYGRSASLARLAGEATGDTRFVAGLRLWY